MCQIFMHCLPQNNVYHSKFYEVFYILFKIYLFLRFVFHVHSLFLVSFILLHFRLSLKLSCTCSLHWWRGFMFSLGTGVWVRFNLALPFASKTKPKSVWKEIFPGSGQRRKFLICSYWRRMYFHLITKCSVLHTKLKYNNF